jgi:hypothetical protein
MQHASLRRSVPALAGVACSGLVLLAGCASVPGTKPPPQSELQLQSADVFALPGNCEPTDGKVYRTRYFVQSDGHVAGATPESGTGCVQDALLRWVETFQYRPLAGPVPATLDWMAVTARRGT